MPKVYGVSLSPFVRKVRVVLAEKNVAYEVDPVLPVNVSAEFKKKSPLGKVPAYEDGGKTLADSSIICAYIERTHPTPALYPSDAYECARATWFEEYADSGISPIAGPKVFFQKIVGPKFFQQTTDEAVVKNALEVELPPMFDYLNGELRDGNPHFVGNQLTIADIAVASIFVNLQHTGFVLDASRWPRLAAALNATQGRPSFQALIAEDRAMLGG
jgi:glutathione S-transferase